MRAGPITKDGQHESAGVEWTACSPYLKAPPLLMDKYIIFGPQGSGKGKQSELLCKELDFAHISIGDILRWHVAHHTKLGARVQKIADQGLLVSDEIVEPVLRARLEEHDWNYGFVLDGFPRTSSQAEYLFRNWDIDKVIYLDLPDEVVYQRVMRRASLGEGAGFTKRADDNLEVLKTRLLEYHSQTQPLLAFYGEKDLLLCVDADRPIETVYADIRAGLGLPRKNGGNPPADTRTRRPTASSEARLVASR